MEKCTLHTDYGDLVLYDREATQVAAGGRTAAAGALAAAAAR